jgi:hypothetical protein
MPQDRGVEGVNKADLVGGVGGIRNVEEDVDPLAKAFHQVGNVFGWGCPVASDHELTGGDLSGDHLLATMCPLSCPG